MDSRVNILDEVFKCIKEGENFVLQGGAGSGKTESLKRVLEHISKNYPDKKVACITHTNLAVDEIISRVDQDYTICTIHSFVNSLIKNYKKNMHEVISEIFKLKIVDSLDHKEYKRIYEKYASRLYTVKGESVPKVIGKRDYDKGPEQYNKLLNENIVALNDFIVTAIKDKDYNEVVYNETRFDSYRDLTFGHDGLLKMTGLLFSEYPRLSKIVCDKYDYIFIDEYQDTNAEIIDVFLNAISCRGNTTIGLFGDSMQGIYEDGIGDVDNYVSSGQLIRIEKEDNYRCSKQVVDFINRLRNDGLKQEVAFKKVDGVYESIDDRQGIVKLCYSIYDGDRTTSGNPNNKDEYLRYVNSTIKKVEEDNPEYRILMLTNKSIAKELDFENLYRIYDMRYTDVKEEIEKDLNRLQLIDLATLMNEYNLGNYNYVISELKNSGFIINSISDKEKIKLLFDENLNREKGAIEVLLEAFEHNLLKESDSYKSYVDRKDVFMKEIETDEKYKDFREKYNEGNNTFTKMGKVYELDSEEHFKELERMYKKERFYSDLFSDKIKFSEIMNYVTYINEQAEYITMHKTKGSGIQNVMVVLEEYFWYKYNFSAIYDSNETDTDKKLFNQKLFYVACSRAIKNLICIKVIPSEMENDLLNLFEGCKVEQMEVNL